MTPLKIDASFPYREDATNSIYELLFCDKIDLYKSGDLAAAYPWNHLFASPPDVEGLHSIISDAKTEARVKILAYDLLRRSGHPVADKELLGVIVEVGLEDGLDVLASYRDGSVRYINYTGRMIIFDAPDEDLSALTNQLFLESEKIVSQIGPWNGVRRPHPGRGMVRISFLVSDGLYFGEGPIDVLFNDPFASPALSSATSMMLYLTSTAQKRQI